MVETFHAEPLKDRRSENLGFRDFAKDSLIWGLLPFMSGGAVFLLGRGNRYLFDNKIPVIDGTPSLVFHLKEMAISRGVKATTNRDFKFDLVDTAPHIAAFGDEANAENRVRDYWNFMKATEIGAAVSIYHLWQKKEGQRLDLTDAHNRLATLSDLKPSDEELVKENASLNRQLAFMSKVGTASSNDNPPPSTRLQPQNAYQLSGKIEDRPLLAQTR